MGPKEEKNLNQPPLTDEPVPATADHLDGHDIVDKGDSELWIRVTYKGEKVVGRAVHFDERKRKVMVVLLTRNNAVVWVDVKKKLKKDRFGTKLRARLNPKNKNNG